MDKNETYRYPVALTIAGSDSGGGAGIQADLKTFPSHSLCVLSGYSRYRRGAKNP